MRRTILIIGAAKRLGAALAQGLARDGHRIAIHFRSSLSGAEKTRELIQGTDGHAAIFQNPMADLDDGERLVRDVVGHFGSLDTLINNAGTFVRKSFDEMTQQNWETGFASTAGAAFIASRSSLPHLRASGRGRIINIGDSMSERIGSSESAMSYYIGKAGVWMMTQTLAATEARHGLTVNLVSPGVLEDSVCATPVEEMPQGRYGTYQDILRPIRFLLEDDSKTITGSHLQAGGGWNIAPA